MLCLLSGANIRGLFAGSMVRDTPRGIGDHFLCMPMHNHALPPFIYKGAPPLTLYKDSLANGGGSL